MKIGIFNEHFNTMGGGEKHIGAVAEYLSLRKNYDVQLITFDEFDIRKMEQKLNLDLSKCLTILLDNHYQVEEFSKTYDIFINASYQSAIKPKARKNIILIFFPIIPKYKLIAKSRLTQKIIRFVNKHSSDNNFVYQAGFHSFERTGKYAGHWTKQNFSIRAKSCFGNKPVDLIFRLAPISRLKFDKQTIIAKTQNGGEPELIKCEPGKIIFQFQSLKDGQPINFSLEETFKPADDPRNLGIFIEQVKIRPAQDRAKHEKENTTLQFFRKNIKKIPLLRSAVRFLVALYDSIKNLIFSGSPILLIVRIGRFFTRRIKDYDYLEYYDLMMANSGYTQGWIRKYWGRESKVLYPRVDVEEFFNEEEKDNKIISVGRFFKGGHSKKQLTMVKVFKKMVGDGLKNWEYHLCGGMHQGKIHQNYLDAIKKEAQGYPIFIHSDISFPELRKLYAKSSIFWHAAGYGEDENKDPDKFEHFGITTVEAMAAGCVPIVINKAGQKEIVNESKNGFLWNSLEELSRKTFGVIRLNEEEKSRLREAAIKESKKYSKAKFQDDLEKIASFCFK